MPLRNYLYEQDHQIYLRHQISWLLYQNLRNFRKNQTKIQQHPQNYIKSTEMSKNKSHKPPNNLFQNNPIKILSSTYTLGQNWLILNFHLSISFFVVQRRHKVKLNGAYIISIDIQSKHKRMSVKFDALIQFYFAISLESFSIMFMRLLPFFISEGVVHKWHKLNFSQNSKIEIDNYFYEAS